MNHNSVERYPTNAPAGGIECNRGLIRKARGATFRVLVLGQPKELSFLFFWTEMLPC